MHKRGLTALFGGCLLCASTFAAQTPLVFEFTPGGNAAARPAYDSGHGFGEDLAVGNAVERSFAVNVRTADLAPLPANATGGIRVAPNASWGQMLPAWFVPDIAIANHAESGETLKSFVTELRLDKMLSTLRAGDWVMIQFGHNDQKAQSPQTYAEAATTYRSWLRTYIAEVRRRGETPILVTSPERRNFDAAGHIVPSPGDYPDAVRATDPALIAGLTSHLNTFDKPETGQ